VEAAENDDNLGNATEIYVSDEKAGGNNPKRAFDDPEVDKVWEIVNDLRRVMRPVSVTQGVQAQSVSLPSCCLNLMSPSTCSEFSVTM
jgi:hypothetical protein